MLHLFLTGAVCKLKNYVCLSLNKAKNIDDIDMKYGGPEGKANYNFDWFATIAGVMARLFNRCS